MFKTNVYFDKKAKSIAPEIVLCSASIGVLVVGEYGFGYITIEFMTVTSGVISVQQTVETE